MRVSMMMTVCFAIAFSASAANAKEFGGFEGFPEPVDREVDLEEAVENAELLYTYEEDGAEWAVYLDAFQNHMWVQPADARVAEGLFSLEEKGSRSRTLLTPDAFYIEDDESNYEYYYAADSEIGYYTSCGSHCQIWLIWDTCPWENVVTLAGRATSGTTDYTSNYGGQYRDLDSGGPWAWSDNQTTFRYGSDYYYRDFEFDDPDGSSDWSYYVYNPVLRFIYYANGYYEYVELHYGYIE